MFGNISAVQVLPSLRPRPLEGSTPERATTREHRALQDHGHPTWSYQSPVSARLNSSSSPLASAKAWSMNLDTGLSPSHGALSSSR